MRLKIGISNLQPGWEIILQQEGLTYEVINLNSQVDIDEYSVLIINNQVSQQQKRHLDTFLKKGGSAIINSKIFVNKACNFFPAYFFTIVHYLCFIY